MSKKGDPTSFLVYSSVNTVHSIDGENIFIARLNPICAGKDRPLESPIMRRFPTSFRYTGVDVVDDHRARVHDSTPILRVSTRGACQDRFVTLYLCGSPKVVNKNKERARHC